MMINFSLEIPVKIIFGRNIFREALKCSGTLEGSRVLLVSTGNSLKRLGYIDMIKATLDEMNAETLIYDKISPDPDIDEVRKAVEAGKNFGAESVIGFGGGSSIDAAKAAACGIVCGKDIGFYYYSGEEPERSLPVTAIPTTAGTGSELSRGAIISDRALGLKKGIRGYALYPKTAIVDSFFTEHIPYKITMETGFDVFAHAVESLVSLKANSFSEMLSLEAIRLAGKNLPRLAASLSDREARAEMSYASMIMGINLANVGTALPHRMQYPAGTVSGKSHAAGLLALYPAWLEAEYRYSASKIDTAASVLAGRKCEGKNQSIPALMSFISGLGVRQNLKELGIDDLDSLVGKVSGNMKNDPAYAEEGVIQKIYQQAFTE